MKVGFDTIGNAILICYDQGSPVGRVSIRRRFTPWLAKGASASNSAPGASCVVNTTIVRDGVPVSGAIRSRANERNLV